MLLDIETGKKLTFFPFELGTAGYQIEGQTIHSLLNLPIKFTPDNPCPKLSGDQLMALQDRLAGCKILVIDEMSMISKITIYQISERLKEAFPQNADKPFGGVHIGMYQARNLTN